MGEFMIYVNALKNIADSHYGKEVIFYDNGEWYSRDHSRNLTPEEVAQYVYEVATESLKEDYIPVDSAPAEPTPDIYDLVANLAHRVTALERITGELVRSKSSFEEKLGSFESQLLDSQRNIERLAQDHENVAFKVVDIEQSIGGILDERTDTKSAEDILREISKLLERSER